MNHQNPPPLLHIQSTTQILSQTTTLVFSTRHRVFISLLVSFLLLFYKLATQSMTDLYYSSMDDDPSIKTYFAQLQNSTPPTNTTHLTGAGEFYSEINHPFFEETPTKPQLNDTPITLDFYNPQLGLSRPEKLFLKFIMKLEKVAALFKIDSESRYYQELTRLFLLLDLATIYVPAIFAFVITRSCIHGVIFVLLVDALVRNYSSISATFRRGKELGLDRLFGFVVIQCLVREALTQLVAAYFLGTNEDQYTNYKVFVHLRFMPFLIGFPPVKGFEEGEFQKWWWMLESLMSVVFAMIACAFMVDSRRTWWDGLKEGCSLLSLNIDPVINLKLLEIVCWWVARFVFGELFGSVIESFIEVHFMVALMMYYFSVKSMDANSKGQPFGQREFEIMLVR